ncbi:MAG: hypothetical protein ACYCX3_04295 [Thermoleophilia bacterium]
MPNRPTAISIDEYIAGFPEETRSVLEEMRALIRRIVEFRVRENLAGASRVPRSGRPAAPSA